MTARRTHTVLQAVGNWIGSSVIHLGDTNVPNALMFIGKRTRTSTPAMLGRPVSSLYLAATVGLPADVPQTSTHKSHGYWHQSYVAPLSTVNMTLCSDHSPKGSAYSHERR